MPLYVQPLPLSGGTLTGDLTVPNISVPGAGTATFGGDANLYRSSANVLNTDDALASQVGFFGPGLRHTGDTGPYQTMTTTAIVIANRDTTSNVPLKVDGMAGQIGDLQQWRNSAGSPVAFLSAAGQHSVTALIVYGNVGFYGTSPVGQPTVTGSRGGNAALASLLTGLATLGLIVDSSTA